MPHIPNFPQDLLDQHHKWHDPTAHPELAPTRIHPMGSRGGGTDFLVFHRNFVAQVMAWYNTTTFTIDPFDDPSQKASLVAPWTSVPAEMKTLAEWNNWKEDASRLDSAVTPGPTRPSDFNSGDDLGFFIESGIHNLFLHGAAAQVFNEEEVRFLHSPQSTLFYKIHGLVQHWWSIWARRYALRGSPSEIINPDRRIESLAHGGPISAVFVDRHFPSLSGQMSEEPVFDHHEIENLTARVQRLEARMFAMSSRLEVLKHPHSSKIKGAS